MATNGGVSESESTAIDGRVVEDAAIPITIRVVAVAMAGGLLGTVLMLPVLVGVPAVFGLFDTAPVTRFAGFAGYLGVDPTLALGVVLFGVGGTVVLPLVFLVVGSFLPPGQPRALRGVSLATIFWCGFVPAFWPTGGVLTVALYLVFSLLAHWVYGVTLGTVLDRTIGIPQHDV
ncbi:cytochrome C oxidase subunit I [Haloprofundus marisrubri]|uniref:Cytochrome C oxidase subunit I n=1 Tax=Haloprofundus marisrubri TaxID=1514971 RepID=A0A0W1RBZ6_9EURY|nr:DUF6789 family protein [Haloprofundus marisrubri]KTG10913.1 cytochrome C oxidase subunit I [Haloprofundus marisrubri]